LNRDDGAQSVVFSGLCAEHDPCTEPRVMVDAALRIRLEGKVEELERAVRSWANALTAARRNQFGLAALMLEDGEVLVRDHGDDELARLLGRQFVLRQKVEALVAARLQLLGMPSHDLPRGAKWLTKEPILYEHDRFNPTSLGPGAMIASWFSVVTFTISRSWLAPLFGIALFFVIARFVERSRVVLTARRLILEGQVIDLTDAVSVHFVRPFLRRGPYGFDVEIHSKSGTVTQAHIRYATAAFRHRLISLGLNAPGSDWVPT
jgi:hypothetical protein